MNSLRAVTENQIRAYLGVSDDEFIQLRNPAPEQMHDPRLYSDIGRLVAYLHEEKARQAADNQKMMAVFTDYDTDGVCASGVLSASLALFGFRYMVGIPNMEEGYGLSRPALDRMNASVRKEGYKLDMLITADSGINAHDGIAYAAEQGITVLVTDHHPAGPVLPQGAMVCVDPWKKDDGYPFKYNSGATVAWKAMLAYAIAYAPEKRPEIERLIVLAGLSNVGDVMPIRDENRYMVVAALKELDRLRRESDYDKMSCTGCRAYDTVFWGLHDLMEMLQASKDKKRYDAGKSPIPLPDNEELISYYLSPMLNAPRRVHGTCLEAMSALMVSDHDTRRSIIGHLIELNEIKTDFRDKVLGEIDEEDESPVVCVNTRHGISGLVAGQLANGRDMPSIVFSRRDDRDSTIVYEDVPEEGTLTASARSSEICPLDQVIEEVNRMYPGMVRGGGHAAAAGITIDARDYATLKAILPDICRKIIGKNKAAIGLQTENTVRICCNGGTLHVEFVRVEGGVPMDHKEFLDPKLFASDVMNTYGFLESLRPFGQGFDADTRFELHMDAATVRSMKWNPDFWSGRGFKFDLYGVECLTFKEGWADGVKQAIDRGEPLAASAKIKLNKYHGKVTPQLHLSSL